MKTFWFLLALCLTALPGCTTTKLVNVPVNIFPHVADELKTCKARPVKPNMRSQKDVGAWAIASDEAGEDCRSKLAKVLETLKKAEAANGPGSSDSR